MALLAEGNLEEAAVEAMRTGLQCSHLAADTAFNQIKAITGVGMLSSPAFPMRLGSGCVVHSLCKHCTRHAVMSCDSAFVACSS